MMNRMTAALRAIVAPLALSFLSVAAAQPLVDVEWVKANAGRPGVVFIDFQAPAD